jgi:hypothetical protein
VKSSERETRSSNLIGNRIIDAMFGYFDGERHATMGRPISRGCATVSGDNPCPEHEAAGFDERKERGQMLMRCSDHQQKLYDANKSAEDLKYYVRSIALLGEMKRAGSHHPGAEYDYLKSCFMKPTSR